MQKSVEEVLKEVHKEVKTSNENTINKHFRGMLQLQLCDFIIKGEQKGKGLDNFPLKEDISFYHKIIYHGT